MRYVKALSLSLLAALSLMLFSAGIARAGELRGDFLLNNSLLAANETVGAELENASASSLLVPNLNFAIRCHTLELTSGTILPLSSNRSFGHATLLYLGCLAFTHKTLEALTKCTVGSAGDITVSTLFHVVRDGANGTAYILAEPAAGLSASFTTIEFGPLCGALADEVIGITGSIVGQVLTNNVTKMRIQEAPGGIQALFKDKLMFFGNQAFLDGVMKVFAGSALPVGVEAGA